MYNDPYIDRERDNYVYIYTCAYIYIYIYTYRHMCIYHWSKTDPNPCSMPWLFDF